MIPRISYSCSVAQVNLQYFSIKKTPSTPSNYQRCTNSTTTAVVVAATSLVECIILCVRTNKISLFNEIDEACRCVERALIHLTEKVQHAKLHTREIFDNAI